MRRKHVFRLLLVLAVLGVVFGLWRVWIIIRPASEARRQRCLAVAMQAEKAGDYLRAEKAHAAAIAEVRKMRPVDMRLGESLQAMGQFYHRISCNYPAANLTQREICDRLWNAIRALQPLKESRAIRNHMTVVKGRKRISPLYDEAAAAYECALASDPLTLAFKLDALAKCTVDCGAKEQSETLLEQAFRLREQFLGANNMALLPYHQAMIAHYYGCNDFNSINMLKVLRHYRGMIRIYDQQRMIDSSDMKKLSYSLQECAIGLLQHRHTDAAMQFAEELEQIYKMHRLLNTPEGYEVVFLLAFCYNWRKDYTRALPYYERYFAYIDRTPGAGALPNAKYVSQLVTCYIRLGRQADARRYVDGRIARVQRVYGHSHAKVVEELARVAGMFRVAKRPDIGWTYCQIGIRIIERKYGKSVPTVSREGNRGNIPDSEGAMILAHECMLILDMLGRDKEAEIYCSSLC